MIEPLSIIYVSYQCTKVSLSNAIIHARQARVVQNDSTLYSVYVDM